ncbi:MAG: cystathionine beta-lyase [Paracoccaceae bacterium]
MKDDTRIVRGGTLPRPDLRFPQPPVHHASTILFENLAALRARGAMRSGDGLSYAVHGTPTTYALEQAIAGLEGGYRTRLGSSGVQALSGPLLSYLSAGDHVLLPDAVYGNTRQIAERMLARMGVETTFYDPLIGGGIRALIRPTTRVVFCESPGSGTFEVQDVPAIAEEAHRAGALVMLDNTWASPLYFRAFEHGVDVSIQAVTKYLSGHSDLVMGAVTTTEAAYPALQKGWRDLGLSATPDDAYLALRGLRTLHLRLPRHWANGLRLGEWLMGRAEVAEVLHPAMPHDPGHAVWARDFRGAGGLFAFVLDEGLSSEAHLAALIDRLELFGLGFSWGGHESLILPVEPERTATAWPRPGRARGALVRLFAGLEDPDDLIADLAAGFARLHAV